MFLYIYDHFVINPERVVHNSWNIDTKDLSKAKFVKGFEIGTSIFLHYKSNLKLATNF